MNTQEMSCYESIPRLNLRCELTRFNQNTLLIQKEVCSEENWSCDQPNYKKREKKGVGEEKY